MVSWGESDTWKGAEVRSLRPAGPTPFAPDLMTVDRPTRAADDASPLSLASLWPRPFSTTPSGCLGGSVLTGPNDGFRKWAPGSWRRGNGAKVPRKSGANAGTASEDLAPGRSALLSRAL